MNRHERVTKLLDDVYQEEIQLFPGPENSFIEVKVQDTIERHELGLVKLARIRLILDELKSLGYSFSVEGRTREWGLAFKTFPGTLEILLPEPLIPRSGYEIGSMEDILDRVQSHIKTCLVADMKHLSFLTDEIVEGDE